VSRAFLAAMAAMVLLAAPVLGGCAASGPAVALKGHHFVVEIADEEAEQTQGLMFRRELASDKGMLFTYPTARPQSFWMRNCYIPLDILFFDGEGRFINGHYGVPPCRSANCPTYPAQAPARYVLELASGVGKSLQLEAGDPLTLP
jgi:uncharacterized membrane protein (UPF0127 family)